MKKLIFTFLLSGCFAFSVNAQQGTGQGSSGVGNGQGIGAGIGAGSGVGNDIGDKPKNTKKNVKFNPLQIISKPQARYTETARQNLVEGKISLRIEFKKNGKIGKISVVQGLPDGLNEEAVKAAEKIRFEPQMKNGKSVTITKIIEYKYTIY